MNNSTPRETLLMQYLDGEMEPSQRAAFEQQLAADTDLRTELNNLQAAKEAVKTYGLVKKVESIHHEMMQGSGKEKNRPAGPATRRIIRYSLSVAAGLLLLALGYATYTFFTVSEDKLYDKNHLAYEPDNLRNGSTGVISAIEQAYRQKDYERVIQLGPVADSAAYDMFLTGLSLLETRQPAEAIQVLEKFRELHGRTYPLLHDAAEYYLALACIRNRDMDQAISRMKAIRDNPAHLYQKKFSRKDIIEAKMLRWK